MLEGFEEITEFNSFTSEFHVRVKVTAKVAMVTVDKLPESLENTLILISGI